MKKFRHSNHRWKNHLHVFVFFFEIVFSFISFLSSQLFYSSSLVFSSSFSSLHFRLRNFYVWIFNHQLSWHTSSLRLHRLYSKFSDSLLFSWWIWLHVDWDWWSLFWLIICWSSWSSFFIKQSSIWELHSCLHDEDIFVAVEDSYLSSGQETFFCFLQSRMQSKNEW